MSSWHAPDLLAISHKRRTSELRACLSQVDHVRFKVPSSTPESLPSSVEDLIEIIEIIGGSGFNEKIQLERAGITLGSIKQLADLLGWTLADTLEAIGSPATLRFSRNGVRVTGLPCMRCVELIRTVLLVRALYRDTASNEFDPDQWLGRWLMRPALAFDWQRPVDWLDTPTGAAYVRHVISAVDAGVYL
jgi:hypothetical protein